MKFDIDNNLKTDCGVYKITNLANKRFYIGSTKNLYSRYKSHLYSLSKGKHHNKFLQNDWLKHSKSSRFSFTLLEHILNPADRLTCEQKWLDQLFDKPECFNHKKKTNSKSRKHFSNDPEVTRKKISAIRKRNWQDPKYRKEQIKKLKKNTFKPKTCTFINPDGKIVTITNYTKFCNENPGYVKQGFVQLGLEKLKSYKGWRKYKPKTPRIKKMNLYGAKNWYFISPKGKKIKIVNLLKFCRDNNLNCPSMHMVHSGKRQTHKGWSKAND